MQSPLIMSETKNIGSPKRPFRIFLRFLGPGFLVTVGFIDPGNWATNIEGGSKFAYELLGVITLSTIILIVIQNMAAKLGIATGKSLAVNIKEGFSPLVAGSIGITVVLACVATDVAELLGGAIGFALLLGTPSSWKCFCSSVSGIIAWSLSS
jgi:manganese transport protein